MNEWNLRYDERCFRHELTEYSAEDAEKFKMDDFCQAFERKHSARVAREMTELLENYFTVASQRDFSVYTGRGGIAFLLFKYYAFLKSRESRSTLDKTVWPKSEQVFTTLCQVIGETLKMTSNSGSYKRNRDATFFTGRAGAYALSAVISNVAASGEFSRKLQDLSSPLLEPEWKEDEVLYGRSGYLLACEFVRRHLGPNSIDFKSVIEPVLLKIIQSGEMGSTDSGLMWSWHSKEYLGAAHGVAGILRVLFLYPDWLKGNMKVETQLKATLNNVLSLQYESGNMPSSVGSQNDRLVQWCHGATGYVYCFCEAAKYFKERDREFSDRLNRAALSCGECVWRRGLLRKGRGLCHGLSGNVYALLKLYQTLGDYKWLHRAAQFIEVSVRPVFDPSSDEAHKAGVFFADTPLSLFEGIAGWIYLLIDVCDDVNLARFPGFDF